MSEINHACALANPAVRSVIRDHVNELPWKSPLAKKLVQFFNDEQHISALAVPEAAIRAHLSNICMEDEIETIIKKANDVISLGERVSPVIDAFADFYMTKMVSNTLEESSKNGGVKEIVKRIQALKIIQSNPTPIDVLGELDVDKVIESELGGASVLPSQFDFVRRATPYQGYLRGQVVQVVAPPGVGKSNFLANEAIGMLRAGAEGYWIALGDMMKIDFITRFTSIVTGEDFFKVSMFPKRFFSDEVKKLLKGLRFTVVPAGYMNADGLADFIESKVQPIKNIDFAVVDYDSNFAKVTDSMYAEGGAVYDTMSRISRPLTSPYRTVFVASQPKQQYWNEAELPMECAAESSRKQAIIDLQITIGRDPKITEYKAGVMKIGKARRGKQGEKSYYKVEAHGAFSEISREDYGLLKSFTA